MWRWIRDNKALKSAGGVAPCQLELWKFLADLRCTECTSGVHVNAIASNGQIHARVDESDGGCLILHILHSNHAAIFVSPSNLFYSCPNPTCPTIRPRTTVNNGLPANGNPTHLYFLYICILYDAFGLDITGSGGQASHSDLSLF